nr:hypothetical protein B0A51_07913 [Rachicladosporium sp. CCFEE 5018]
MRSSPELSRKSPVNSVLDRPTAQPKSYHNKLHHNTVDVTLVQALKPQLMATMAERSHHQVDTSGIPTLASSCIHCTHPAVIKPQQGLGENLAATKRSPPEQVDVELQDIAGKSKGSRTKRAFRKILPLAGATVGLASLGLHIAELVAALS